MKQESLWAELSSFGRAYPSLAGVFLGFFVLLFAILADFSTGGGNWVNLLIIPLTCMAGYWAHVETPADAIGNRRTLIYFNVGATIGLIFADALRLQRTGFDDWLILIPGPLSVGYLLATPFRRARRFVQGYFKFMTT